MNEQGTYSVKLEHYQDAGWKLVKANPQHKGGVDTAWQKIEVSLEDIYEYLENGGGVGVQVGDVSGGLSADAYPPR